MRFAVFRKASTMEDEGRDEYLGTYDTKKEAEEKIEAYLKGSKGYYHVQEMEIVERP